jgi:hypothetical protein
MDPISLLETHAQLALTLAGFAGVVGALARPLTPLVRHRFLVLLSIALRQVVSCVLPVWLFSFLTSEAIVWRVASLVGVILYIVHMTWAVWRPRPGSSVMRPILNATMTRVLVITSWISGIAFALNAAGVPFGPGFTLYYLALLSALVSGFIIFAGAVDDPGNGHEIDTVGR